MQLLFFVLLICGLLMVCLEIFLPGGIIGFFGALALIGAIIIGFLVFGPGTGGIIAVSIIILLGVTVLLWIKFFPQTRIGKSITLSANGKAFKSSSGKFSDLAGKEGESFTELRPAGMIIIDGSRYDVVTEGNLINKGKPVRVISVHGNRIVVRQIDNESPKAEP